MIALSNVKIGLPVSVPSLVTTDYPGIGHIAGFAMTDGLVCVAVNMVDESTRWVSHHHNPYSLQMAKFFRLDQIELL